MSEQPGWWVVRWRGLGVLAAVSVVAGCAALPSLGSTAPGDGVAEAQRLLAEITVAAEDTGYDYDRDDWPHWSYAGDYCTVRDVVLQQQAEDVRVGQQCALSGTWVSPYDDVVVTDTSELDIDHIVPLAEVADSGSRDWTEAEREAFANDTRFLVAVTASSNRSKSDQDPAEWLPPDRSYHCEYVMLWVQAKHTYGLTVDQTEREALDTTLARC